jgi:hypothetical protein
MWPIKCSICDLSEANEKVDGEANGEVNGEANGEVNGEVNEM